MHTIPKAILLVDDNPDDLAAGQRALAQLEGVQVTSVDNPYAAMDACQDYRYDLIILDIYLPELSGPKIVSLLSSYGSEGNHCFLFVSGNAESKLVRHVRKQGAEVIEKPLRPEHIRAALAGSGHSFEIRQTEKAR
ncbi:response regulator [Litorivicinus lipolyticus]|uniref:response regulator n=1 Tax=Litorivicinus lipolyticus TaxID=418701 RepID=UPI003B5C0108